MNSQTVRRPDNRRATRSKTKKYVKQTAHVEARRDGKPLIFGWGGHLSRSEKTRIQRIAIWSLAGGIAFLIVAVLAGFWLNINVIAPARPITTVNGHDIPQSDYRKLLALKAQLEYNKLYGKNGYNVQSANLKKQVDEQQATIDSLKSKIDALNKQIKALPAGNSEQRTSLTNQLHSLNSQLSSAQTQHDALNLQYQTLNSYNIPNEQQLYTQSQQGNDSATWLQDDELIREWLAKQNASIQAQINPSASAVDKAVKDFANNLPSSTSYSKFLSSNRVSDSDVHAMMTLVVRRNNMQDYQASLITSPAYQVHARAITSDTQYKAQKLLQQIKQGSDFAKLAKAESVDTTTKNNGGDLGWLARGQYAKNYASNTSGVVDNWIFNQPHQVNELSPVLSENGSYHIVQIIAIDSARPIDSATLSTLKSNALTAWLLSQKALPGVKITPVNQDMLLDPNNMPPGLPSSAPSSGAPGSSGVPGVPGVPGSSGAPGAPSSGAPTQ